MVLYDSLVYMLGGGETSLCEYVVTSMWHSVLYKCDVTQVHVCVCACACACVCGMCVCFTLMARYLYCTFIHFRVNFL